jgi:hypothetical protein
VVVPLALAESYRGESAVTMDRSLWNCYAGKSGTSAGADRNLSGNGLSQEDGARLTASGTLPQPKQGHQSNSCSRPCRVWGLDQLFGLPVVTRAAARRGAPSRHLPPRSRDARTSVERGRWQA